MTARLLDGKKAATQLKTDIRATVDAMKAKGKRPPGLAVILVGKDPASQVYVSNKRKTCEEVGFNSFAYDLPENTSEQELLLLIDQLNHSEEVDGILVQLPLPLAIDTNKVIEAIQPDKDVDGFHPYNIGCLQQRNPKLRPCTPFGIINLLKFHQISLNGLHTLVIGASNIVGRPMASEFLLAQATVTIAHRFTKDKDLEALVRMADLIVVATGVQDIIDVDWLNEKKIVVDVGIHRLADGKLRGDIDFEKARKKVAWITPVPGGVGPMTIVTLLQNTLVAYKEHTR